MAHGEKPETGKVIVIPTIPLLPSGVYDTGTLAKNAAETDLAENPPGEKEKTDADEKP